MERFSELLKGKFAFGCMRMQCKENGEIDMDNFRAMVDCYLDAGFNYFDTAHVYFDGKSELALKEGLTSRYPRESYVLTNKLTSSCFETEADIRPLFETSGILIFISSIPCCRAITASTSTAARSSRRRRSRRREG